MAGGDKSGLKSIYNDFKHAVYSLAYTILGDKYLAEDVSHNVFLKILSSASSYKTGTSPKAWIMQITRNTAIDELRKKRDITTDFETNNDNALIYKENYDKKIIVFTAVNTLEFEQRQIVVMHVIAGLTFREIGELLNQPIGTVAWKYRTSINKLKVILK
ncbi:RNA polymerase sigma factor [Pseudobacteroides cellulosolvens]|uniref:RNA polymerase sigma factor n=1 Tax=Pseudobacteroides cellulosolvens TaxID=35825 RepID=UPI0023EA608F|nr:RNA polymerase sigma factor [Pseudobacteroides cellulosolvens]